LYPARAGLVGIGAVQPDRLAELLLGDILGRNPNVLREVAQLAQGVEDAVAMLLTLLRTAAHPQYVGVRSHARDLVVTQPRPFAQAANMLALTLAQAGSRQGLEPALVALTAISKDAGPAFHVVQTHDVISAQFGTSQQMMTENVTMTSGRVSSGFFGKRLQFDRIAKSSPRLFIALLADALNVAGVDYPSIVGDTRQPDRSASEVLDSLYRKHFAPLVRYAAMIVGPEMADDVVQDAFVGICRSWNELDSVERMDSYLFSLVRRTAYNALRRREDSARRTTSLSELESVAILDDNLESLETRLSLAPLLERLTPLEKRILLLHYFGNMTLAQVATEVGYSHRYISRKLRSTRARLGENLLAMD